MNPKVLSNENEQRKAAAPAMGASATSIKPLPEDALILIPMRNTVLCRGAGSGAQREESRLPPPARPAEERRQIR
jgi:hypothetical protein